MLHTTRTVGLFVGCLMAASVLAQGAAQDEANEYGPPRAHPPRIDFKSLGISAEQAGQVHQILHQARENGAPREQVRSQLSGVLNASQLGALEQTLEARRANRGSGQAGQAGQGGQACPPKPAGAGNGVGPQGMRPAPRARSGS